MADHSMLDEFQAALIGLRLDDDGLARGNDLAQLEHISELTFRVIEATDNAATPRDLLARRLAKLAQQLIRTLFGPSGKSVVHDYLIARSELAELTAKMRPESG